MRKKDPSVLGEKKLVVSFDHGKVRPGSFGKIVRRKYEPSGTLFVDRWWYCREYFQNESRGIRRMLYSHRKGLTYNIACFMREVEKRLKVEPKSTFGPTQKDTITWIAASWWTTTSMKRSLFTALLRAGANYRYTKDNFEQALFSIGFTKNTRKAVERFMKGHTRYAGKVKGWYNQFKWGGNHNMRPKPPSEKEIKKLLIKP